MTKQKYSYITFLRIKFHLIIISIFKYNSSEWSELLDHFRIIYGMVLW